MIQNTHSTHSFTLKDANTDERKLCIFDLDFYKLNIIVKNENIKYENVCTFN